MNLPDHSASNPKHSITPTIDIFIRLALYPTLAHEIRVRMREELFNCFWQDRSEPNGRIKCHHLRIKIGQTAVQNVTRRSAKMLPPETKKERVGVHATPENGPGSLAFATFGESKVERELPKPTALPQRAYLNQKSVKDLMEPVNCQRFRLTHISVV